MKKRKIPSIEQARRGGRKRAEAFTSESQSELGRRRAQQLSFLLHNRRIAPDGFSAQSAYMRGPSGLRLLHPEHVQFLLPEQLRGPGGALLTYEQQRIFFGLYVWKAIWDSLAPQPQMPTDQEFLAYAAKIQNGLHHGLDLENPLHVIYAAPNEWCDETGEPWAPRKQRRLFRQALATARAYAEALVIEWQQQALAERMEQPRQPGQRRPQSTSMGPTFGRRGQPSPWFQYGRPDLPSYHPYNLIPQRPYGVPTTNNDHPIYWLPNPGEADLDD